MITVALVAFALLVVSAAIWILLTDAEGRGRRSCHLLWVIIALLPILSMVTNGRPLYGEEAEVWAAPLVVLITPLQVFGAALALIVCWGGAYSIRPAHKPLFAAIVLYGACQLVSDLFNDSLRAAVGPVVSLLVLLAVLVRGEELPVLKRRITWLLRVYTWGSILVYLMAPEWSVVPSEHGGRDLFGLDTRFIGLTAGPNYIALIAALAFLIEIYPVYRQRGWLASANCALVICLWSQGRSAIVILAIVLLVLIGVRSRSREWFALAILAVLAAGAAGLLMPSVQARLGSIFSRAGFREITTGRSDVWALAWEEFLGSPLVGHGSSVFGVQYWSNGVVRIGADFANAHDQFLQALAQGGILGLVTTILLLGAFMQLANRVAHDTRGLSVAILAVVMVQLAFGTPLRSSGFSVNLIVLAFCIGVLASSRKLDSADTYGHTEPPRQVARELSRRGANTGSQSVRWVTPIPARPSRGTHP